MTQTNDQVWFITGANKGLGAAFAKEALGKGYKVVATARKTEGMEKILGDSPNLLTVSLDITNEEQVQSSVNAALDRFGRIDVLINNAGYSQLGFFEEMSEGLIRQQMETNVFGTMKLTRAVLPTMRKQGSGWIIVISSASGVRSVEGGSIYSASKFALEGWTEGLSVELKPFGIRCMLVEPGPFRTDFLNEQTSVKYSDIEIGDYKQRREAMRGSFVLADQKQPGDPAKLSKALMMALDASNPPLRLLAGKRTVETIDQYFQGRLSEYQDWREVSANTDFD
ncbi:NADP-dependent 3-hydroxy acid dehydrogenase YdfG [Paenibacillus sophorae]|uniref:NADP-dependent 3-hydroxy acid dehydrogenase YdfG n=1 Tax=Paenibacillus sophorae TaxID=1333845 RepID=A0A1H8SGS2_9BACL|nr:SDR family oxidoreductase [Paenibacillus sophorae]QWU16727.1 SDR family oxidoreductase [Paenibacillus sophorae]SEO77393.1 NADP-dependent 3-hydroxy acid dehydrogenase YdfG [Paenibacillus sophorae]